MSKIIATAAIRGAYKLVNQAEEKLNKLIEEKGEKQEIGFPNTAYYLPFILSLFGIEVLYRRRVFLFLWQHQAMGKV